VGPRAGLDDVGNRKFLTLPALELRPVVLPINYAIYEEEEGEEEGVLFN
jgi:hypothetical protein